RGVEVERVDAVEVEDDGDGRDVGGDLDEAGAGGAGGEAARLDLLERERTIRAGELAAAGREGVAAAARADRVVLDGHGGGGDLERGDPRLLRGLPRGCAGTDEGAGGAGVLLGAETGLFVDGARREGERPRGREGAEGADTRDLHCVPFGNVGRMRGSWRPRCRR